MLNEVVTLLLVDVELLKLVDPLAEMLSDLDSLVETRLLSLCELLILVVDSEVLTDSEVDVLIDCDVLLYVLVLIESEVLVLVEVDVLTEVESFADVLVELLLDSD